MGALAAGGTATMAAVGTAAGAGAATGLSAGTAAALIGGGSALSAAGSLGGSALSSSASSKAAGTSAYVSELELLNSQQQAATARAYQDPFVQAGYSAIPTTSYLASLEAGYPAGARSQSLADYTLGTIPGYMSAANAWQQTAGANLPSSVLTESGLQQTPGYQFTRQQGLAATQAAAAARGLGVSGSSLKGAATYATGLADATYANRFNEAQTNYLDMINQSTGQLNLANQAGTLASGYINLGNAQQAQQQQQYNQNYNLASLGQAAASGAAAAGTTQATQANQALSSGSAQYGNYLTQSGQAQAAGTAGVGNAATSGINNYLTFAALSNAGLFGNSVTQQQM